MKMFGSFSRPAVLMAASTLVAGSLLAASQTGEAKVKKVVGSVTIDSAAAQVGDIAKPGQTVTTGADSKAFLFLGINGPDLNVLANSKLLIENLSFDDAGAEPVATTKLALKSGLIEGNVKKTSAQSSYVVTTPTTTAAIRGTQYTVTFDGLVVVWDGCVDVVYRNANFNVCKGQVFDPSLGGAVGGVTDFSPGSYPSIKPPLDLTLPATVTIPSGPTVYVSPR